MSTFALNRGNSQIFAVLNVRKTYLQLLIALLVA